MAEATYEQVMTALRNADKAGDVEAATRLAKMARSFQSAPKKTSIMEDIGIGIEELGHSGKNALDLLAGAAARYAGATEDSDAIFAEMEARKKGWEKERSQHDQGFGGKVISGATGLVPAIVGGAVSGPMLAAGMLGGTNALSQATTNVQNGASVEGATVQAMGEGLMDTLSMNLPVGKGIKAGAAWGAGGNVASQLGADALGHLTMPTSAQEPYKPSLEKYGVSAAVGAVGGSAFGHMNRNGALDAPNAKPKPEDENPLQTKAELESRLTVLNNEENMLLHQLATTRKEHPKTGEENPTYKKYVDALARVREQRTIIEDGLGIKKPTEEVPTEGSETTQNRSQLDERPVTDESVLERERYNVEEPPMEEPTFKTREEAMQHAEELKRQQELKIQPDPELDALTKAFEEGTQGWTETTHLAPDTPAAVHDTFMSKLDSYRRLPDEHITAQIERRKNILENPRTSMETHSFVTRELEILHKIQGDRAAKKLNQHADAVELKDNQLANSMIAGMKQGIDNGGIRGGLEFIASNKNNRTLDNWGRYLGHLAQQLLDNPRLGLNRFTWDQQNPHLASYNNMNGEISMRPQDATPGYFLHEAVHHAVNRAIDLFQGGYLKDISMKSSVHHLDKLYQEVKSKHMNTLIKVLGKENASIATKNMREFVAYGLTDNGVQNALRKVNYNGFSAFSKFKERIANLLGLDKNAKTALDAMLEHGGRLIENSDGVAPKRNLGDDPVAAQMDKDVVKISTKGFSHVFTQTIPQMYGHLPFVKEAIKVVQAATKFKEALDSKILYGSEAGIAPAKGFFLKLSNTETGKGVVNAMYNMKNKEIVDVWDKLTEGMRKGDEIQGTITRNSAGWNEGQVKFAKALADGFEELYKSAHGTQKDLGFKHKIAWLQGYVLTSRTGDHYVNVNYKGVPLRAQAYLTKAEADHWIAKFKEQAPELTISYENKKNMDRDNLSEALAKIREEYNAKNGESFREYYDRKLDDIITQNSSIGGHTMQSNLLRGFTGDQAGLSAERRGELLREAIPRSIKQYTQNILSREVQKKTLDLHAEFDGKVPEKNKYIADFYIKSQVDRIAPDGSAREKVGEISQKVKENISAFFDEKAFGFTGRDKHASDRFFGLFSSAFYLANITMKPTIWLAQPLQSLMSVRGAFKNAESPSTVLDAMGQTIKALTLQNKNPDKEFLRFLDETVEEGTTLHPQMHNEFNDWKFGTNPNSKANVAKDVLTGQSISGLGDKFSRVASLTFFYHLHKLNGLSGEELKAKAKQDTTDNMVGYGAKNLPAIYREFGMAGEQASPLRTFAHAQAGNLMVDVRDAMSVFVKKWDDGKQRNALQKTAPLMMSAAMMMLMGGALSVPILAEYELLRLAGMSQGWWGDRWPSATDALLDYAPTWVQRGVLSGATGVDLDASMRYTSVLSQLADVERQGIMTFFPHLGWGANFISGSATIISDKLGKKHTAAEMEEAYKKAIPKGILTGVVDTSHHRNDDMTLMGPKGGAGVKRGTEEVVSRWLGTRSVREANDSAKLMENKRKAEIKAQDTQRAAQLFTAGHKEEAIKLWNKHRRTAEERVQAVQNQRELEQTEAIRRGVIGKSGTMSLEQQRNYQENNMRQYMENRK